MEQIMRRRWIMGFLLLAFLTSCAGPQKTAVLGPGERELTIKADSFHFEPNYIKAAKGEALTLKLENVSGIKHNLTILSPEGKKLVDVDLPAKSTTTVRVNLTSPGIYPFYCDKMGHSSMGMKGKIEIPAM